MVGSQTFTSNVIDLTCSWQTKFNDFRKWISEKSDYLRKMIQFNYKYKQKCILFIKGEK